MTTNVYVDGPNLYYSALRDSAGRWLDLRTWASRLLPGHEIKRVRYATALVNPIPDRGQQLRQRAYLRALATDDAVSIHLGRWRKDRANLPDARRPAGRRTVLRLGIKGVDVLLATHMVADAADGDCDTAVVVTSDSDLVAPIAAVRARGVTVGVVNPRRDHRVGAALHEFADFFVRPLPSSYLGAQLPLELRDAHGVVHAPKEWVMR